MLKQRNHYPFIVLAAAGLILAALAGTARAQSQDDSAKSVAEAARRTREQKKNAKPVKTITNDDLPKAPAVGSNEASAPANPPKAEESGASATGSSAAKPANPENAEKAKLEDAANVAALERAKKALAQSESELDVMQRKARLDSDAYYSNPDFSNDKDGKAKLDAEAQEITTKQEDIETLKARIAELQAAVDAAAPPAPPAPEETKPPSQ